VRFGFAPVQSEPRFDAMIAQARLAEHLRYEALGVRHIACLMNFGKTPLDLVKASLRRFGAEVLPRFR